MTATARVICSPDIDGAGSFAAPPPAAVDHVSEDRAVDSISALHSRLGNAYMINGDLEGAAANYKAALRLAPQLTSCWCNLGNVHLKTGRAADAVALYVQALTLNPAHWPSRTNLVHALVATKQYLLAKVLLLELIDERPHDVQLRHQLGKLHSELSEFEQALECFEQAVMLDPDDSESLYWIGGIRQKMGQTEAAEAAYVKAAVLQPLIRRPAAKQPADFRVLALRRSPATCRPNICSRMRRTISTRWRCSPPANTTPMC
jgi:Flp pilus assembly protein TadD